MSTQKQASSAQKRCMSHLLRNSSMALEGTVALIENESCSTSREDLIEMFEGIIKPIQNAIDHLKSGTFCTIDENECKFVGRFVGCDKFK